MIPFVALDNNHFPELTLLIVQVCLRDLFDMAEPVFTAQFSASSNLNLPCQRLHSLLGFRKSRTSPFALDLKDLGASHAVLVDGVPREAPLALHERYHLLLHILLPSEFPLKPGIQLLPKVLRVVEVQASALSHGSVGGDA